MALYYREIAKRELNDHKGPIADFIKAIEINIKFAEAYFGRGTNKIASS